MQVAKTKEIKKGGIRKNTKLSSSEPDGYNFILWVITQVALPRKSTINFCTSENGT
jgi:hypothetical protein